MDRNGWSVVQNSEGIHYYYFDEYQYTYRPGRIMLVVFIIAPLIILAIWVSIILTFLGVELDEVVAFMSGLVERVVSYFSE